MSTLTKIKGQQSGQIMFIKGSSFKTKWRPLDMSAEQNKHLCWTIKGVRRMK